MTAYLVTDHNDNVISECSELQKFTDLSHAIIDPPESEDVWEMAQPGITGLSSDICPRILEQVLTFEDDECLITLYSLRLTSRYWSALSRVPLEELLYSKIFMSIQAPDAWSPPRTMMTKMTNRCPELAFQQLLHFMSNIDRLPKKYRSSAAFRFVPTKPVEFLNWSEEPQAHPHLIEEYQKIYDWTDGYEFLYSTMLEDRADWTALFHLDLPLLLTLRALNKHIKVKYLQNTNALVVWKEGYDVKAAILKKWIRERQEKALDTSSSNEAQEEKVRSCGEDCEVCAIKWGWKISSAKETTDAESRSCGDDCAVCAIEWH